MIDVLVRLNYDCFFDTIPLIDQYQSSANWRYYAGANHLIPEHQK